MKRTSPAVESGVASIGRDRFFEHFIAAGASGITYRTRLARHEMPWREVRELRVTRDKPLAFIGKGDPRLWIITTSNSAIHVPLWSALDSGRAARRAIEVEALVEGLISERTEAAETGERLVPVVAEWRIRPRVWQLAGPLLNLIWAMVLAMALVVISSGPWRVLWAVLAAVIAGVGLWALRSIEVVVDGTGVSARFAWNREQHDFSEVADSLIVPRPWSRAQVALFLNDGEVAYLGLRQGMSSWSVDDATEIVQYLRSATRSRTAVEA